MKILQYFRSKLGPNEWAARAVVKGLFLLVQFHFFPKDIWNKELYKGRLPNADERLLKTENPFEDFPICPNQENALDKIELSHVILRGDSFDQSLLDDLDGRIFLVNWKNKVGRKDVYYATGDQGDALSFAKKGMFPILFVRLAPTNKGGEIEEEPWYPGVKELFEHTQNVHIKMGTRFNIPQADTGSGIAIISVVMKYTDELQVHGWDHYLNSSPKKSGYLRKLFSMVFSSPSYKHLPVISFFRSAYNFHYGYRFSLQPKLINHGFTAFLSSPQMRGGKMIATRLDKIFYK